MIPAIAMNLIAMAVLVGGWSAAVWAVYKKLGDPYRRPPAPRPEAVRARDAGLRREPALTGSRTADRGIRRTPRRKEDMHHLPNLTWLASGFCSNLLFTRKM